MLVIGCSGAGKSTLAARIAERTGLPYVATDEMYWETDWRPAEPEAVTARLHDAIAADDWVLDGNFVRQRDILWSRSPVLRDTLAPTPGAETRRMAGRNRPPP